ncbi:MAG: serine/threonine protein kinase, partial [Planctomycetota bacterium]|nr:serine/threonine protein kinase [Planctomycetota bacterium]
RPPTASRAAASDVMTGPAAAADEALAEYGTQILESLKGGETLLSSVSRYQLKEQLGEGGMGTVFLADHISEGGIRKPVAIKVLKELSDAAAIERFVKEAQLLAHLSHGTIVELLALESMEVVLRPQRLSRFAPAPAPRKTKLYFMVMEYVDGPSLEEVIRSHAENVLLMHPAMVGFVMNKAVIALAEAHTLTDEATGRPLNLVHRDLTPSNILFNAKAGITKLADFGVAKAFTIDADSEQEIVGKPRYMAPEQLDASPCPASDIWSLGITAYEALTGFAPYRSFGKTFREKALNLRRQFGYALRPPKEILAYRDARFDLEVFSDIIMRCLQKDPEARPTAQQLNSLLEGGFLYNKGLGPTNKTLAAYLRLLENAVGEGEIIPPEGYEQSEDAKTICATLWVHHPTDAFRRRSASAYNPAFVRAVKAGEPNPCLYPDASGIFQPVV